MDAVLVVPLAADERASDAERLIRSSGIRDAVFCVDEDYPHRWPHSLGHVARVEGFGLGKALDAGFRLALQLGAEWIVRSDNHVEFLAPASRMLDHRLRGYVLLPVHYTPEGVMEHGLYLSFDWGLEWNREPLRPLPCATNPVFAVHRSLVELLLSVQGFAFAVPYFGKEGFDFTLSLARLGHPVLPVPTCAVVHYYKKSWPAVRVERACTEPWCGSAPPGSAYFLSMEVGSAIFALRHRWNTEKVSGWALEVASRYYPDRCRYLQGEPVPLLYARLALFTSLPMP